MTSYRGLQARINPMVDLTEIKIALDPFGPPTVTLTGRIKTGNRRVDLSSTSVVHTMELPPEGVAFIQAMKTAFTPAASGKNLKEN